MRRVLVTAGGTSEPVDQVRMLTNRSSGRLGSLIADAFAVAGAQVDCICGENALKPSAAEIHTVGSVRELEAALEAMLSARRYSCVIHAMAVSDYTLCRVVTAETLAEEIAAGISAEKWPPPAEHLVEVVKKALFRGVEGERKISSDLEGLCLLLERTPKLIDKIRLLQPDAVLVGFKLLSGATETELLQAAQRLMQRSGCDYVIANDQQDISGDNHRAMLVGPEGILRRMESKQEIADLLASL